MTLKILVVITQIGPIFKAKLCHFYHETVGFNSTVGEFPPNPVIMSLLKVEH